MKYFIARLLIPILDIALAELQQQRKAKAIKHGITGLELYSFMVLGSPYDDLSEPSQVHQSDAEAV